MHSLVVQQPISEAQGWTCVSDMCGCVRGMVREYLNLVAIWTSGTCGIAHTPPHKTTDASAFTDACPVHHGAGVRPGPLTVGLPKLPQAGAQGRSLTGPTTAHLGALGFHLLQLGQASGAVT